MHSPGLLFAASKSIHSHAPLSSQQLMADGKSDIRGPAVHLEGFCSAVQVQQART